MSTDREVLFALQVAIALLVWGVRVARRRAVTDTFRSWEDNTTLHIGPLGLQTAQAYLAVHPWDVPDDLSHGIAVLGASYHGWERVAVDSIRWAGIHGVDMVDALWQVGVLREACDHSCSTGFPLIGLASVGGHGAVSFGGFGNCLHTYVLDMDSYIRADDGFVVRREFPGSGGRPHVQEAGGLW